MLLRNNKVENGKVYSSYKIIYSLQNAFRGFRLIG
jgi:hypothetical protein